VYFSDHPQDTSESVDSMGIPGWDQVDKLARYLVSLTGISVTSAQAEEIKQLYDGLIDYDKRPLTFEPIQFKRSRGRFAQKKSAHVGVTQMKRYIHYFHVQNFNITNNLMHLIKKT